MALQGERLEARVIARDRERSLPAKGVRAI